ncbi:T9SS type A sorting domain-containing protein [Rhodocytophaga rosea]|uniref:T9SS type A sorting domain-containing protein n=1 Tax=Rhodocytophaga rosea TaxID=2704465 RepID=A0A6C0GJ20_9BACT|nr:T9SS type A sorting domain-containing protein [Rhodocytophaga rosea]
MKDNILYAGGDFNQICGEARRYLAAIDISSGTATSWAPTISGRVTDITAGENAIYIVGQFLEVSDMFRKNIAAIDIHTGVATSWYPNIDNTVSAIAVSKSTVYLGGYFTQVNGQEKNKLAAVDLTTGKLKTWNAAIDSTNKTVYSITISNDEMYIGGNFKSVGGRHTGGLAAMDAISGKATPWNLFVNDDVYIIKIYNNTVYFGGYFTKVNGQQRSNLAAVDLHTGLLKSWDPNVSSSVTALEIINNTIYIGGRFDRVSNQPRLNIASFDLLSGSLTPWNIGKSKWGFVNCMAVSGDLLYVAGDFYYLADQQRINVAAIDTKTGAVTSWYPKIEYVANRSITGLGVSDNTVYISGNFFTINGVDRKNIAAIDASTGELTSWYPNKEDYWIWVTKFVFSEDKIFTGGAFYSLGGQRNSCFTILDKVKAVALPWNYSANNTVSEITLFENNIYIGGIFTQISGKPIKYFAAFGKRPNSKNVIAGSTFIDNNQNCKKDSSENNLSNVIITAEPGPYYGYADAQGNYSIAVDTGTYTVKQILPNGQGKLITQLCPPDGGSHTVNFKTYNDTIQDIDFANQVTLCPNLTVDVASDRRRRCLTSRTLLSYANTGFASAANVKVHVKFPAYVVPVSASKVYTITPDSVYVFDIGTLEVNQSGVITIMDSVLCGIPSIRGLTQCTKAWITPANTCLPTDSKWDKSYINLQAGCKDNGVVRMAIYNQGSEHMADSSNFRIYADAVLVFKHSFKLSVGDSLILQVPANGQTLRLEVDQRPYHPKEQTTTITIEACGKDESGKISKGFVTQLPVESESPEVALECLPITDSYDPNDKLVVPQGTTASHYTPSGKALNYTIRFQNTGTDTAYKVMVVDTLDANLDVATFSVKAASHPYEFSVSGKGRPVLTFTFNNINLPDSNRNEALSHGYIKFNITPHTAIAQGTVIENHADVFFDYNPVIRTNTVTNTIFDVPQTIPVDKETKVVVCSQAIDPFAGENRFVCAQDTVVLQGVAPDFGTGTWHLLKGSGKIQETHNPNSLITGLGYGENVFEWRTPANTCTIDSLTSQVSITNFILPLVKAVSADNTCGEGSVKLVAHGASGYKWYSSLSATEAISTDSVFTTPVLSQSTTYYVAAVEYGCEGPKVAVQAQIQPLLPTPVILQISADSLHCSTQASSYEWFLDDIALKVNTQSIKVVQAGAYTVKAITNACDSLLSEAYTYEVLPTGITEESTLHIKIYPNPAPGRFALHIDLKNEKQVRITIYNTFGSEVYTNKFETTSNMVDKEIDCSTLGKGLFILKVQSKSGTLIEKLLIQ